MDQYIRGTVADQMGDHYRAAFHYQEAIRQDSASAFLRVALAQNYLLLGNPELADAQLDRALRIDPNHVPALELKVVLLRGLGNHGKSQEYVRRLVALAPRNPRYVREMLGIALVREEYEQAERLYRRLVGIEGETEQLLKQVLTVYLVNGQHRRAIPLLEELRSRDTTDAAVTYSLGTTYLQAGDTLRAIEFMTSANRLDLDEPRYWVGLSVLALDKQNVEHAVAVAESGLVRIGPHAGLMTIKGNALNRLGRTSEAIVALHEAISLDSTMYTAMGTLALIYDRLDSLERVEELYGRAIEMSDSAAVYLNNLAYAYAQRGFQLTRAKHLVERALELEPGNPSYLDTMGWVEFKLGNNDSAIRWLKKAVAADPRNAEVLEHLGDAYAKEGTRNKAQKHYRQALQLDPDNEQIRQKLAR